MAYTHDYTLKIGDYTFNGEVEIGGEGVASNVSALSEPINPSMPMRTKDTVREVLDLLGELDKNILVFKLKKKGAIE